MTNRQSVKQVLVSFPNQRLVRRVREWECWRVTCRGTLREPTYGGKEDEEEEGKRGGGGSKNN